MKLHAKSSCRSAIHNSVGNGLVRKKQIVKNRRLPSAAINFYYVFVQPAPVRKMIYQANLQTDLLKRQFLHI
jgi:hypothetical protein